MKLGDGLCYTEGRSCERCGKGKDVEIVKTYIQRIASRRFIGKRYTNGERSADGMFGAKWDEWHVNGWFALLKEGTDPGFFGADQENGAAIGLMREENGDFDRFEYWIGLFFPEGTAVPKGFDCVDFPASEYGVCWVFGKENEIFGHEALCLEHLEQAGFESITDWCFERYVPARFENPDEKGNVIIDIGFFVR